MDHPDNFSSPGQTNSNGWTFNFTKMVRPERRFAKTAKKLAAKVHLLMVGPISKSAQLKSMIHVFHM